MISSTITPNTICILQNADPVQEREFLEILANKNEILLRVPLPSHGSTNSYLDICSDLIDASYFCETIAVEFDCGKLERRYEQSSDFFLLAVKYQSAEKLASALFHLQWVFNIPEDQSFEDAVDSVREAILDHEENLSGMALRYPEVVDAYFANLTGGAYYEYEEDALSEEFAKHPERRFGFWKSPYFSGDDALVFLSHDIWLVSSRLSIEEAFDRHQYETKLSLLNADMISLNEDAAFLSERMMLNLPLRQISKGLACLRFLEEDIIQALWPSSPRFFVSEFKDFAVIESSGMTAVFFHVTENLTKSIDLALTPLLEKYRSETYSEPVIEVDWTQFDDEKFEELCYDLVYHDSRFNKETIRKMGKSRSRDGGRDIVAMARSPSGDKPRKFIFQCKAIAPNKSVTTSNLGSISDVVDQYDAGGYVVMTCGYIDATVYDRLDAISKTRNIEVVTWSRFEIERFLARRPSLLKRYIS